MIFSMCSYVCIYSGSWQKHETADTVYLAVTYLNGDNSIAVVKLNFCSLSHLSLALHCLQSYYPPLVSLVSY